MDERINHIEKEYELLKDKFPKLVNLNKRILEFHKEKLKCILEECEKSIENIKKSDVDITNRQLQIIYLYRHMNDGSL